MVDHLYWLLFAALLVGLAKGGLSSAGGLAVPLLSVFMHPIVAAALLLPIFLITDVAALWLYRRDFSGRNLAILVPAILFGIGIATLIVPYAPEALLLAVTGGVGLWAVWRRWFGRRTEHGEARIVPGLFWGTIAGVTTFITHSGGPPTNAYLLPQNLPRLAFAGTMAIAFAIANFAKIPSYAALGMFEGVEWSLVVNLAAVGLVGTFLGRWIVQRLTDKVYSRVIEVLLLALSTLLLGKALLLVMGG